MGSAGGSERATFGRWRGWGFVALLLAASLASAIGAPGFEVGTVVTVFDGDTLVVAIDGRRDRVRICGIDAPERGRDGKRPEFLAAAATEFTRRAVLGEQVRLQREDRVPDRDRYGRLLRHVITPAGESLAEQLLAAGLARVYRSTESMHRERFLAIERLAREQRVGIFSRRSRRASDRREAN